MTDKQTEALKLALEALNSFPTKHLTPFISSARTALREALASEASEESSGTEQPAQRQARSADTWVGLTDEDIQEVRENCGITHHAIKTIEAKLREKNT